ncbi:MAG: enoyl-CoA hydratase/isomerase family protein [Saprospiraceae bacterium]|jgi:methylglutaconyl-CoA hydratase|nr:enoyl-CoA hydratase/isomerase family protein [Saprospiraceae bacterium]
MDAFVKKSISENGLGTIEFFTPAQNSLPTTILKQLVVAINELSEDSYVKLILIKSEGERAFCAGASFTELGQIKNETDGHSFFMGFANVINAIRTCNKMVLGRVHGKAVGGGVGLAAACDYALATKNASIRLSELAVGIGPFVIGPAVERKTGFSAFSQLSLNATEWQTANWAKEKGLFHEVFETTIQLDEYIAYFTEILLSSSQEALFSLKKVFWDGTDHWGKLLSDRAAISGKLILTEDAQKALAGFKSA